MPASRQSPTPPDRIGPWRLERRLGQGGMADVYVGVDDAGARATVKWLHHASPAVEARFEAEIRYLARLDHPNVARYRAHGTWEGRPWVAMDYVEGQDLRVYAERLRTRPPAERHERARHVARALCRALAYVHGEGLVHRDVKPGNVLLGADNRVVLTDFGVASAAEEGAPVTAVGLLVGTAAYAAPEQLREEGVGPAVDQYGLGCTLYHLLTGRKPFEEETTAAVLRAHLERDPRPPSELDPTIPADLEAFVLRLMAKEPGARFPDLVAAEAAIGAAAPAGLPLAGRQGTIDAIAAAVDRVAAGQGVVVRLVGARGSGRHWMAALARDAAVRRGLPAVHTDDPLALEAALHRVAAGEALLVVTTRPVEGAEVLALRPLTVADVRRSAYALAPRTADLARVAERLHRESGGNAGLFLALVAGTIRGEAILLPEGPLDVDASPWLEGMDLDESSVAGALAVLREPVDEALLEELAQVPVRAALGELVERGVAAPAGARWVLAAEALRHPLLDLLPDPEGVEERARMLLAGGREPAVEDPLLAEVAALREGGQAEEAVRRLRAAPDDPDRRPARVLALAGALWQCGDAEGARAAYEDALRLAPGPDLRTRACVGAGTAALQLGELDHALDRLSQAVVEADLVRDGPRAVSALLNAAEARALAGDLAEALRAARRALAMAEGLRDRALEAAALRHLGQVLLDVGLAGEAGRRLADAAALAKAAGLDQERHLVRLLRARAALEERPGNRTAAAAALDRLLPLLTETGRDVEGLRLLVGCVWAQIAAALGDRPMYQRALAVADPRHAGPRLSLRLRAEALLARAAWWMGDRDVALDRARAVRAQAEARGFRLLAWEAACVEARASGAPLPPPGTLAAGLDPTEAEALERRG